MYMKKWYNEREQSNVIEAIFNQVILKRFEKKYNQTISYNTNENDTAYQDLVFQSSDLMSEAFQYLEWGWNFHKDLFSCSVVNSDWFYHVWNVNSVYKINSRKLIHHTLNSKENEDTVVTRGWQRLINPCQIVVVSQH